MLFTNCISNEGERGTRAIERNILNGYEYAEDYFAEIGVDTEKRWKS